MQCFFYLLHVVALLGLDSRPGSKSLLHREVNYKSLAPFLIHITKMFGEYNDTFIDYF